LKVERLISLDPLFSILDPSSPLLSHQSTWVIYRLLCDFPFAPPGYLVLILGCFSTTRHLFLLPLFFFSVFLIPFFARGDTFFLFDCKRFLPFRRLFFDFGSSPMIVLSFVPRGPSQMLLYKKNLSSSIGTCTLFVLTVFCRLILFGLTKTPKHLFGLSSQ